MLFAALFTDGHLQKRGNNYRFKLGHCLAQKDLVDWEYKRLKRLCKTTHPPKEIDNGSALEFYTSSGLYLKPLHDLFYEARQEVNRQGVPKTKYVKVLTPELLAVLPKDSVFLALVWCCDGSVRSDCYAGRLALHSFSRESQLLFVEWLKETHGCGSAPHS